MSAKLIVNEVIQSLKSAKSNMRCSNLEGYLTQLGFDVRDEKRGGHKIFSHDGLPDFMSGSYNCGHGKNPEIKAPYISKVVKIIEQYESELIKYLEEK